MTVHHPAGTLSRPYARIAGLGYLIIIIAGLFGEFVVRASLIVPGDAAATAANIAGAASLYRAGLAAELIMVTCDVLVAFALYMIFEHVNRPLALLAAFLRLTHAAIVAVNLVAAYAALLLVGDAAFVDLVPVVLTAHGFGYVIGLLFFGVHCLVLSRLILMSEFAPGALGVLLVVAGAAYMLDSFARTLLAGYDDYAAIFTLGVLVPAFITEVSFTLWLLVKGYAPTRTAR